MKKLSFLYIVVGLFIMGSACRVHAEIGIINTQAVFERYDQAIAAEKEFQEKREKYDKKLANFQEKVETARSKKTKEAKINKMIAEMQEEMQPLQEELLQFRNELTYSIRQKILAISRKVAKDQGLEVVLEQQAVLIGGYDITEFVLDQLNEGKAD